MRALEAVQYRASPKGSTGSCFASKEPSDAQRKRVAAGVEGLARSTVPEFRAREGSSPARVAYPLRSQEHVLAALSALPVYAVAVGQRGVRPAGLRPFSDASELHRGGS
jgi:hypothetical protein